MANASEETTATGDIQVCSQCRAVHHAAGGEACQFNVSSDQESLARYFLDRQKFIERNQAVVVEWRQIAAAVDRILFWIFCFITSVSSALFLVVIPGLNRGWFDQKLSEHPV